MIEERPQLIPPDEARPSAWGAGKRCFSWRRGVVGATIGLAVGTIAWMFDASPWWWLAILVGFSVASTSLSTDEPVIWSKD